MVALKAAKSVAFAWASFAVDLKGLYAVQLTADKMEIASAAPREK